MLQRRIDRVCAAASPLERVLADRLADEAYLHQRHNELVDLLEYLRPDYIAPGSALNRLLAYALDLADLTNRLMGGNIGTRYSPPGKAVQVLIGEPLNVQELLQSVDAPRSTKADMITRTLVGRLEELSRE